MPVKLKLGGNTHPLLWKLVRAGLVLILAFVVIGASIFSYYYFQYRGLVAERLAKGPLFPPVAQIYAAPQEVRPGQELSASQIAAALRRAGYNSNPQLGSYELRGGSILIKPGSESYLAMDGATIATTDGQVQSITAENGAALSAYKLEPQLITALSEDNNRTKRRLVTYNQIPPQMVQAVLAIEDRRFFEHSGINYVRTAKCAVQDILAHRMNCGGSTLTQQLARGFFLSPEKTYSRKIAEIVITFQLESRFTKQQIFEMYANEINLGQRGSFAINGFGEAAQAYFGKDLRQLDLADCALLAGMIQRPNYFAPYRHPERAMDRRNLVLDSMVETGAISQQQAETAKAEPIRLAPPDVDASEAPYFVDLVHDEIVQRLGESTTAHSALRIYTSLDPELQIAAAAAVEAGMKNVDELVRHRYFLKHHKKGERFTADYKPDGRIDYPQVALVALNPHTGQVLALIGGRNYGESQLDHALAERPTGSIFKPFVYAAAYGTSLDGTQLGSSGVFTALTKINDDPQDFSINGRPYIPGNFVRGEYPGMVTAADALAHSLNIATIALAQMVGYDNVAALARSSGIVNARGTPSVAIGTYSASPLEMAGAYTVFANNGVHLKPWVLASVRNPQGDIVADFAPEAKQVVDPRAAFLTQSLLEGVMNYGTGISVRQHGFTAPAAGKTGTENDSWFAGYSSNLLCVIWVGNNDYTDIKLQGADAAAPIWAEFMNRAIRIPQYSDMKTLGPAPSGVEVVRIDRATDLIADDSCPSDSFSAAFLIGTAPESTCSHMGENSQSLGSRIFSFFTGKPASPAPPPATAAPPADATKHRNLLQKIFGTGKDKTKDQSPQ
ncbi:MAG: transglycosylase domain-containing protein [Acidobacteriaceae bacterium]